MNADDFLKDLAKTADSDQGLAGFRSMATMIAAFYVGLLADEAVDEDAALAMTCELIRCSLGDHKAS